MKRLLILLSLALLPLFSLAETPYLQRVTRPDEMIFSGPSYDEFCVGTVREAGVYTIVEEADDGEGHLWGRLKSGVGWIDLTHVRSEEVAAWPISAAYEADCPAGDSRVSFCMEDGEYASWIVFRAYEPLTDVSLVRIDMAETVEVCDDEPLCILPELAPDMPLVAGLVFYGDMTTYGLICTDAEGERHLFLVSISGRNGMLILEKWEALPLDDH